MRNFKITICYDGSEFFGWQMQPGKATVQGALVEVASKLTQENVQILGSGRTDAGVHALGQVAHFKTASASLDARGFQRAFNALLPAAVRVVDAEEVGLRFNSRHDALAKTYQYRIYRGKILSPFERKYVMYDPYPLDVAAMAEAARYFEGTFDFTSMAASTGDEELDEKRVTTRVIYSSRFFARKRDLFSREGFLAGASADVIEADGGKIEADELVYVVRGKSFMRYMVRKMVGTLLDVGRGKLKAGDIPEIIAAKDRARSGGTAPALGLYLVGVEYAETWKL
ncbi:MAG TPA: tRNA pseudouridine synthase A [Candidatus Acidoferrales bacterium]